MNETSSRNTYGCSDNSNPNQFIPKLNFFPNDAMEKGENVVTQAKTNNRGCNRSCSCILRTFNHVHTTSCINR